MTAALYVDVERGPYAGLGLDCWGVERDAKRYEGPGPVVAHPPCGPWGRYWRRCWRQDASAGVRAVEQVIAFGGVLEHPAGSRLWGHLGLPRPGDLPWRGAWTVEVDQCRWGHPARKRTWLLCVGVEPKAVVVPPWREPTTTVERMPKSQRHLTPGPFAEWLVGLVRTVRL